MPYIFNISASISLIFGVTFVIVSIFDKGFIRKYPYLHRVILFVFYFSTVMAVAIVFEIGLDKLARFHF